MAADQGKRTPHRQQIENEAKEKEDALRKETQNLENPVGNLLKQGMASDKVDPLRISWKRRYSMGSRPNPLDNEFRKEADEISAHPGIAVGPPNGREILKDARRRQAIDPNLLI